MTPERWQKIDQLFHSALAQPPEARALFLAEACAGDEAIQKEVELLIQSHEQAESFIEQPAGDLAAELVAGGQAKLATGQRLGRYQITALGERNEAVVHVVHQIQMGVDLRQIG